MEENKLIEKAKKEIFKEGIRRANSERVLVIDGVIVIQPTIDLSLMMVKDNDDIVFEEFVKRYRELTSPPSPKEDQKQ